jgi:ubiquinone/menaquinone biosynthesis C-methylase UbiE
LIPDPYRLGAGIYDIVIEPFLKRIRRRTVKTLLSHRPHSDARVLEVACGTGTQSQMLSREDFEVIALDKSRGMIHQALRKGRAGSGHRFCAVRGDAAAMPFGKGAFDAVIAQFTLHEMAPETRKATMEGMLRTARDDALFLIVDFVPTGKMTWMKLVLLGVERLAGDAHYHNGRRFVREGGLFGLLRKYGLEPLETDTFLGGNVGLALARRKQSASISLQPARNR